MSKRDVDSTVERSFTRSLTGADQRVARNKTIVAYLSRVYGEMQHKSRDWPMFDERSLGQFLFNVGVDVNAAVKAHEDAVPPPPELADTPLCIEQLRGCSFIKTTAGAACLMLADRSLRSPHRQ